MRLHAYAMCAKFPLFNMHIIVIFISIVFQIQARLNDVFRGGGGVQGGTGSRITRKENSLSQFHDENKNLSRFTKKNSCKQYYDMYKIAN